ncbi:MULTISPECIES: DUF1283 family protein [Proteus]|jgi:hypothetical protein|uniref:Protein of uncharacterized function (DUF1283) n=1 Tax=Proteus vulgaris TaxID=585 RepID=A0A379F3M5_PROVU|nr:MULTISPECIES: DUF1283 family protein [Proteus]NBN60946.1 DUF1283 family protein [Proteus sp. G2639]RNT29197.1 DUF1283 family protein [Proteus mirabilis]AYY80551.1 DUF1283 family protein [Proteus vulgaris]KGA60005.1 hypothetical protein DR95_906 [Proteus vulgaris]MBG5971918.1 DUF1283 family protein [Proteus vulgaris]
MINTLTKKPMARTILFSLFLSLSVSSFSSIAASTNVTINGNGYDNVLDKEQARQLKEDWDQKRELRTQVNQREKIEFNKVDKAIDERDACLKSANVYAYWEPETRRCLDSNTGRPVNP